uniref:Uncharacterized protein n=1 Tax=Solanum tuberosum TaxID=4113 RepID=M1CXS9_SOLTU
MLLYHLRKGKIAAKMEKSKNVEVKTIEESLRMKLRRLKQEIREMGERGIEVELATAAAQAKSEALDAELAAKMARYAVMNEETVAMRKEHDAFNNDITMRLEKLHRKYPFFNQKATNSGPEGTGPESVEESIDLISRDGGKKRMRKPPPKHISLPPVANTAVRGRSFGEGTIYLLGVLLHVFFSLSL